MHYYILSHNLSFYFFFFFNDTATTEIYTLSLHDALPIYLRAQRFLRLCQARRQHQRSHEQSCVSCHGAHLRSEEHTSELQSQSNLVCRLLLEKKKNFQTLKRVRSVCQS